MRLSEESTVVVVSKASKDDDEESCPPPAVPPPAARGAAASGIALIVATVIVDAMAPLLQERASRRAGFSSSSMVLAETMSYYWGGLLLAVAADGLEGLRRCLRPARYAAFLPASAAFSTSNFLTYIAVRGLGASQFYLLAQLRVAVLAVFLRLWSGVRQPTLAWLALLQLAVGMMVLVWTKAGADDLDCVGMSTVGLFATGTGGNASGRGPPQLRAAAAVKVMEEAAAAAERAAFVGGVAALAGVVLSSSFGFLYLEWQLKSHAQDPLFVQLHQMNSFGAAASLLIRLGHGSGASASQAAASAAARPAGAPPGNATVHAVAATAALLAASRTGATAEPLDSLPSLETVLMLACIITRGVLSGSVLKQLGAIAKGLIDVTAIVLCTGLQMLVDGGAADGTVAGIQALMLLSIISYILARSSTPVPTPKQLLSDLPMLELRDSAAPPPRLSPKVL